MRKERDAAVGQRMERMERVRTGVRLRKGQPVSRSDGIGVSLEGPVFRPAADVAHLDARILPQFVLNAPVELQSVGRVGAGALAKRRISQSRTKAVRGAGGRLVGVVQEPAIG